MSAFSLFAFAQGFGPQPQWSDPWASNLLWSAVTLVVVWVVIMAAVHVLNRTLQNQRVRHKSRKFLYYLGTIASIIALLSLWSGAGSQIALVLSVVGAALAFALQQPLVSLAGWLYVVVSRPYDVGDRIEIGGFAGDVIDIRLFKTVLLETYAEGRGAGTQSTGRVLDLPNSTLFSETLVNITRGFEYVWNEYAILLTFESNWEKGQKLLQEVLDRETVAFEPPMRSQVERMSRSYMIHYENLTPMVYVVIRDSGVELGLRYLTPARQRRTIRDKISRQILEIFEREPDLEFAYPTWRIFRREIEEAKLQQRPDTPPPPQAG